MMSIGTPSFELKFRPSVQLIALVRCFVSDFYANVVTDEDTASRLALVTHELLENAVKYAVDGETILRIDVDAATSVATVYASNRADDHDIEILKKAFDEIRDASDADALYEVALARSAIKSGGSGGLGLARIWAEGGMVLDLVVEDDRVEIRARGPVQPKPSERNDA